MDICSACNQHRMPVACNGCVKDRDRTITTLRAQLDAVRGERDRAVNELAGATVRMAAMEAALMPFALEADQWVNPDTRIDLVPACGGPGDAVCVACGSAEIDDLPDAQFTLGDLRRARLLLTPTTPTATAPGPWRFARYVDGVKMAEDVEISRASSLAEAVAKAARICPKRPMTVLVHAPVPTATAGEGEEKKTCGEDGICCACGYAGDDDVDCTREDGHCDCWFEGPDATTPTATAGEGERGIRIVGGGPTPLDVDPDTFAAVAASNTAILRARAAESGHDIGCSTIIYPKAECDCGKCHVPTAGEEEERCKEPDCRNPRAYDGRCWVHEGRLMEQEEARARIAELEGALGQAQEAAKGFIVAQGRHLPDAWRDLLIEKCGLVVDAVGFVSVPARTPTTKEAANEG